MMKSLSTSALQMGRGSLLRRNPRNILNSTSHDGTVVVGVRIPVVRQSSARYSCACVMATTTSYSDYNTLTTSVVTDKRYFGTNKILVEQAFEGVSDDVSKQILHHSRQPQTAVSLKTLLQTGRGEFLHKTYKQLDEDDNHRGATGKVLMQVSGGCTTGVIWCTVNHNLISLARVLLSCIHGEYMLCFLAFSISNLTAFFFSLSPRNNNNNNHKNYNQHRLPVFFAANFPFVWPTGLLIWRGSPT